MFWKPFGKDNSEFNNLSNPCPITNIFEGNLWFVSLIINLTELSSQESSYRLNIQDNLYQYLDVWNLIDNIWHLKPLKFEYMNIWKSFQEKEMFLKKGNALKDDKLSNFLRMLNVSIPQESFELINAYALLLIDQERKIVEAGLNLWYLLNFLF